MILITGLDSLAQKLVSMSLKHSQTVKPASLAGIAVT